MGQQIDDVREFVNGSGTRSLGHALARARARGPGATNLWT
jgi:hypothetical protein